MTSCNANALVFKFCPPLLALMAISILIAQFSPGTNPDVLPLHLMSHAAYLGQTITFVLVYAAVFIWAGKPKTTWDWICVLSAAVLLPTSTVMLPYSLSQTVVKSPVTFDLNVIPLDGAAGFQPSIEMGRIFVHYPYFANMCQFFYDQILVIIAIAASGEAYYGRRFGVGAIATFLLMSSLGFMLYFALPVVGPAPYFGDTFPLVTGQLSTTAPRNCMPSLHTAYALAAFLSTRGSHILFRIAVGIMALLVVIATLGLGEHYLTDLVLAFPLLTLFRAVSTTKAPLRSIERIFAVVVPALLLLLWGSTVRGALVPPHITGFVVVAMITTVGASLLLERLLAAVENQHISALAVQEHSFYLRA